MAKIEELKLAIATLEAQRATLGDTVVDAALAPMREKLSALQFPQTVASPQLKYVSVLFTDIVDSTRMGQDLDPEDNMAIMDGALQRFNVVIEQHGGRVLRFMGDGLLAIFGVPLTREDDAERAVQAGIALIKDAVTYARQVEQQWGLTGFSIRVGINTGQVILGGGVEADRTAMGMAINLAARMETSAPVGHVLISHATYRHVKGLFKFEAQPPRVVKGQDKPVLTYVVLEVEPHRSRRKDRGIQGVKTHMVGRDGELGALKDAFRRTLSDLNARLVTIVGEAGIGKSRLLAEFDRWLEQRPEQVVRLKGQALMRNRNAPYNLLRNLCTNYCDILEIDTPPSICQKLEESLGVYFHHQGVEKAHFVGALLGYDLPESLPLRSARLAPRQLREQGLFYMVQLFQRMAQANPVLFLLDDIHWADEPSLDAIQQLLRECADLPILVITLARPELFENHPQWGNSQKTGTATQTRIPVSPLTHDACHHLINDILKRASHVPLGLKELLVKNAAGNPFYIEELVKNLIEDGIISPDDDDTWHVQTEKLDVLHIPTTLTAVLQARLDSLPQKEKQILQEAAVVGMVFWDAILQALEQSEQVPEAEINALAMRELILPHLETTFQGTHEYALKHALLREATYATVLKHQRKMYHARAADWLSNATSHSGRADEYAATIAEHYAQAGEKRQAAKWFIRAGKRAKVQGAIREAHRFLEQAIQLIPPGNQELRWSLLIERGEVLGILGASEERQINESELLELASEMGDKRKLAEAYYRLGLCATLVGDERQALHNYDLALDALKNGQDDHLVALLLAIKVVSQTRLGDYASAAANAEAALTYAMRLEDDNVSARVLTNIAIYFTESGDLARAVQLLLQQVDINRRTSNRFGEAIGLANLGYDYLLLGLYALGQKALEDSLVITTEIGARQQSAYSRLNLGLAYIRSGMNDAARQAIETSKQELTVIGDTFGQAASESYFAHALEINGDFQEALEQYRAAQKSLQEMGIQGFAADALAGMVRCLLELNRLPEAIQAAQKVWELLERENGRGLEFPTLAYQSCAAAFQKAGDGEQYRQALSAGYTNLVTRANQISNNEWRNSFIDNVPEHSALVDMWKSHSQPIG